MKINYDLLTPEYFDQICKEAVNPITLKQFSRGLRYLNIESVGHFLFMNMREIELYEQAPNFFWDGPFMNHYKSEQQKVSKSLNIIALVRFGIGKHLFINTANEFYVQLYSYLRRSHDPNIRLVAKKAYIFQKKISTYTEDYDVLTRISQINSQMDDAEKTERELNRELFVKLGEHYIFNSLVTISEISTLCKSLTAVPFGEKKSFIERDSANTVVYLFTEKFIEDVDVYFPIKWNFSKIELVYLFKCLIEFGFIPSLEMGELYKNISKNFVDNEGKQINPRSLARVYQEANFTKLNVFDIQKNKGRRYPAIYQLVRNSLESH